MEIVLGSERAVQYLQRSHISPSPRPPFQVRRSIPPPLEHLLEANDRASCEAAWAAFLDQYSRLILHVARSIGGSHDAAMDRYAHALEQLRRDDYQRLRSFAADGRGKFTTWLVVVVRRLCLDQARTRYGRDRGGGSAFVDARATRRRLVDLVGADVDTDLLASAGGNPEDDAAAAELRERLRTAIADLDPGERLMLRLRFQDEVPVKEIARVLSLPSVFHVYRSLNRILEQLRTTLRAAGVDGAFQ